MHIWGPMVLHPMTLPLAEQFAHAVISSCKYLFAVYGAVLQPTVEDFKFLFDHIQ